MRREIREYMCFRKSLGFATRNTAYVYAEFDRYLENHHRGVRIITRPMVVNYLATTGHLHSGSRAYRVTLLRGFCRYLYQKNSLNYVPEPRLLPGSRRSFKPHVYSNSELDKILQELRQLKKRAQKIPDVYSPVVALLAVTGLRVGEAARLSLEDVDIENGVLTIQRSKFYKSRLVPISKSTAAALAHYRDVRLGFYPAQDPKAAFFVGVWGRRVLETAVSKEFRKVIRKLKLKTGLGAWPRLHDLRHSFATRWLEDIYESGKDPSAHLPILATYLGHVNLDHTQTYLHPSNELLAKAGAKFQSFSQVTQ